MAKSKKKNLPVRLITVKSEAYGDHQRAARGTFKPAPLNSVMQESAAKTALVNNIAKGIKDAHAPFSKGIKDGPAWQRLLSIVRSYSNKRPFNYSAFEQFEFDAKLTLTTLCVHGNVYFKKIDPNDGAIETSLFFKLARKRDSRHAFRLGVIVSFYRSDWSHVTSENFTKVLKSHELWKDRFTFKIPEGADAAVVAVNCELLEDELDRPGKNRRAMRIVATAKLLDGASRDVTLKEILSSDYNSFDRKR